MRPIGDEYIKNGVTRQIFEIVDQNTGLASIQTFYMEDGEWKKLQSSKNLNDIEDNNLFQQNTENILNYSELNFQEHKAKVVIDIDFSGSMLGLYITGKIQEVISRLFPLALKLSNNCELDVWTFDYEFTRMTGMSVKNFEKYVDTEILKKGYESESTKPFVMYSTQYAPVLKENLRYYFNRQSRKIHKLLENSLNLISINSKNKATDRNKNNKIPVYVIFITDGENFDEDEANKIVLDSSNENMFIQFVGISDENFDLYIEKNVDFTRLKKLNNVYGREFSNTSFIKVDDFNTISDDELYKLLTGQYTRWLRFRGIG